MPSNVVLKNNLFHHSPNCSSLCTSEAEDKSSCPVLNSFEPMKTDTVEEPVKVEIVESVKVVTVEPVKVDNVEPIKMDTVPINKDLLDIKEKISHENRTPDLHRTDQVCTDSGVDNETLCELNDRTKVLTTPAFTPKFKPPSRNTASTFTAPRLKPSKTNDGAEKQTGNK